MHFAMLPECHGATRVPWGQGSMVPWTWCLVATMQMREECCNVARVRARVPRSLGAMHGARVQCNGNMHGAVTWCGAMLRCHAAMVLCAPCSHAWWGAMMPLCHDNVVVVSVFTAS